MVKFKFRVGEPVLLSNPKTRYGLNAISTSDWGEYAIIDMLDGELPDGPTYMVITKSGARKHVVESMLSRGSGPW